MFSVLKGSTVEGLNVFYLFFVYYFHGNHVKRNGHDSVFVIGCLG